MSVFNKQQQDWIKDILTKSRNDITDLGNEIKESALPLIMQHEQNGPGSTDGSNGGIHHLQPSYPTSEMLLDAIRHPQLTSMTDPNGMTILPGATNSNGSALLTLGVAQRIDNSNGGALPPNDSDMRYSNLTNAITNSKNHGDGNGTINTGVGKPAKAQFKCEQCNMIFGSKSAHTSHMKSHKQKVTVNNIPSAPSPQSSSSGDGSLSGSSTSADPYQCDVCKKTFAVPARLVRHYRTHTGERPFECEFCHKMFSVKENLQVHRRIHTKERPYKCDVCGRAFEHSGKLHRHMRIHTGERPHKCTVCNKTFIQSGQLVIHMRTHTGEKPYRCPVEGCGKGFTCSKQLKVHSRTHTGEKPYHCDICFRDFGYNHVLKLHRVQHYGAKCYKCTLCDETFKNKKEMETHIKGHANDLPDDDDDNNTKTTSTNGKVELIETNSTNHQNDLEKATSNLSTLANASSAVAASLLADTPRDTSSSEVTSDGDEFSYFNMYTRYEQALGNSYTTGRSPGLNPALLAAVSIAASANSASSFLNADDLRTNNKSEYETMNLSTNGSTSNDGNHHTQTSPFNYESITLMRQNVCFPPPQVAEFKPSIDSSSDLVKRVEAAIASTEDLMTPPRSGSDSPDRSSTPESDSLMMSDRKISTLPPRKRKLYLQDEGEDKDLLPTIRMNSVIRFAKAS